MQENRGQRPPKGRKAWHFHPHLWMRVRSGGRFGWTLGHLDRWVDERKRTNPSLASKSRFSSTKVGSYLFQTVHKLAPNIFNNLSKIISGFVLQSYSEFFS